MLLINLLISSGFTLASSYNGKLCYESSSSGVSLQNSNKNFYYFIIFNIFVSLFLTGDSALSVYNSFKSQEAIAILPIVIYIMSSLVSLMSSLLALDCYNRSIKEPLNRKYDILNVLFKGSLGIFVILVLLLRSIISPFIMFILGLNSILATYIASNCRKSIESNFMTEEQKLNDRFLNYNFYFSIVITVLILLNILYNMYL